MGETGTAYSVHEHCSADFADSIVNEAGSVDEIVLVHLLWRIAGERLHGNRNPLPKLGHHLIVQDLHRFQDAFRVNAGLVIVHLRRDHVADSRRASLDPAGGPVQSVRVALLERQHALVDVLEDVILGNREEIVDRRDVVHRFGQDLHLVLPGLLEGLHVLLGHLAAGPGRQDPRGVYDLGAEAVDLRCGVADHLHAVFVVGHAAHQVSDLDELVGMFCEHHGILLHLLLVPVLGGFHQDQERDASV